MQILIRWRGWMGSGSEDEGFVCCDQLSGRVQLVRAGAECGYHGQSGS